MTVLQRDCRLPSELRSPLPTSPSFEVRIAYFLTCCPYLLLAFVFIRALIDTHIILTCHFNSDFFLAVSAVTVSISFSAFPKGTLDSNFIRFYTGYLEKAFDRVPREVISWAMHKLGVEEWLVSAVMSIVTNHSHCSTD